MALRVVVAGLGPRGQDWVREVNSNPRFELVAAVDSDPAVLEQAAASLAVPTFSKLTTALERASCDAVIVATSVANHVEPCELAIARGLAVLVEKPFTLDLAAAVRLVSLAEQKRVPLLVAQNYRYMRAYRTVRRLLDDDALGPIGMITCQYYRVPQAMAASLAKTANSALWGAAVHHLDALRYVLRRRFTGVLAESFTLPWGTLPTGGSMQMLLTLEGDVRVLYSVTYESTGHEYFERGQEFYLRFVGARGTLHVFQRWLALCETGKLPRLVRRGSRNVTEEQTLLEQLARALLANETPEVSGTDNLQTMAVVEASLRSAATRAWVNPQELLAATHHPDREQAREKPDSKGGPLSC